MKQRVLLLSEEEKQRRRALVGELIQFRNDTGNYKVFVRFADHKGLEYRYVMKCWHWHRENERYQSTKKVKQEPSKSFTKITKVAVSNESVKIQFGAFSIDVTSTSNKEALTVALQALEAACVL